MVSAKLGTREGAAARRRSFITGQYRFGQQRRFDHALAISAIYPGADISLRCISDAGQEATLRVWFEMKEAANCGAGYPTANLCRCG